MSNKKYSSFGLKFWDLWRVIFLGLMASLFTIILSYSISGTLFLATIFMVAIFLIVSYTTVYDKGDSIEIRKLFQKEALEKPIAIETWWSYETSFGEPNKEEGLSKVSPIANKINVFALLRSAENQIVLSEQIYLGSKFPNNHNYIEHRDISNITKILVWDIDKALDVVKS